jgi:hypothetical protein
MNRMRPAVIVHGAWHQPAHYRLLADQLRERGAEVAIPDIGMRTLAEQTAIVQAAVDAQREPPVVIAHSYGGASGGAVRGAHHILFLTAWVLDVGESGGGWLERFADARAGDGVESAMRIAADGRSSRIDPGLAVELFYADCPPTVAEHAARLLRPDLLANFAASPEHAAWRDTPTSYVVTSRDRTWPAGLDHLFASRCSHRTTLPTSHSPYLSCPAELAAHIGELL